MKDKLEYTDIELLEYVELMETLCIPEIEEYEYYVEHSQPSAEAISRANENTRDSRKDGIDCTDIFRERYNDGEFKRLSYDKYIKDELVQQFITDLGLDKDKFWFAVLFLYDFCESLFLRGTTMKLTPFEQLREFVQLASKGEVTISFKAGKAKGTIDDPHAISFIAELIAKGISQKDEETFRYLGRRVKSKENIMLKDSPLIAFFANRMLWFFDMQPQIVGKRKRGAKHSIKETDLVCQLIHFTHLSNNKSWLMTENENLKAYLKQYKGYEYPTNVSGIYPEFLI